MARRARAAQPVPAQPENVTIIQPQPGPQTMAAESPADVVIFGGGAGGGKTWLLLAEPLRHINNGEFTCAILRRTRPELTKLGGIWDESQKIYKGFGGVPREMYLDWKWPGGARLAMGAIEYDKDLEGWKSSQIALLEFDQLETFTENQWWYMFSRNRSVSGVHPYIRASCNPMPDSWLSRLISWWIDEKTGYAIPERSGVIRYFFRPNAQKIDWADSKIELLRKYANVPNIENSVKSFTYIPASVYDNKILLKKDPTYIANLMALTDVERERLMHGNWKIKEEAGKVIDKSWFKIIDTAPLEGQECRFFDLAATEENIKNPDPDFTASVLLRKVGDKIYILDADQDRIGPADVDDKLRNTGKQDAARAAANGLRYRLAWEEEGGSAGKRETRRMVGDLSGIDAGGVKPQGDKLVRIRPFAAQAKAGNVYLVRAPWNEMLLNHLHNQPARHDDLMDACSGAYGQLTDNFSQLYDFYKNAAEKKKAEEEKKKAEEEQK